MKNPSVPDARDLVSENRFYRTEAIEISPLQPDAWYRACMANQQQLAKLKEGVEKWNQWRDNNTAIIPDLAGADLGGANVIRASLSEALLQRRRLRHQRPRIEVEIQRSRRAGNGGGIDGY